MRNVSLFLMVLLAGLFFVRPAAAELPASVVISEVAWMGDDESYLNEWIELYNANLEPIDLTGWMIIAEDGSPKIQLSETLNPDTYLVLYRGSDRDYTGSLKNETETLWLQNAEGDVVDTASWNDASPGDNTTKQTMERAADGSWGTSVGSGGTPGAENSVWMSNTEPDSVGQEPVPQPEPEEQQEVAPSSLPPQYGGSYTGGPVNSAPYVEAPEEGGGLGATDEKVSDADYRNASLLLSELLPDPEGRDSENEFVEIVNNGENTVSLDGWEIRDASGKRLKLSGTVDAGSFVVFFAEDSSLPSLNNNGDVVELLDPSGTRRDGISYAEAPTGLSLNLTESGWRWSKTATPGSPNHIQLDSTDDASDSAAAPLAVAPLLGDASSDPPALGALPQNNQVPAQASLAAALGQGARGSNRETLLPWMLLLSASAAGSAVFYKRRRRSLSSNTSDAPLFAVEHSDLDHT